MDKNLRAVLEKRIDKTVKALRINRFDAHYLPDRAALFAKITQLLHPNNSCAVGGSVTLQELDVPNFLSKGDYTYFDRYAAGIDTDDIFRKSLTCDVYFTSTNAITESGELYNMDGKGNRVAAIAYGPKKVIVISGSNKIVANLTEARARLHTLAAPANALRVNSSAPCTKTGVCIDCKVSGHICSHELVSRYQNVADRITVLILPESYGY